MHSTSLLWLLKAFWGWNLQNFVPSLIEILWSNLTLEQNSSWIWPSAGCNASSEYSGLLRTSIGVLADSQIQELFCLNSTTKFLSVKVHDFIDCAAEFFSCKLNLNYVHIITYCNSSSWHKFMKNFCNTAKW